MHPSQLIAACLRYWPISIISLVCIAGWLSYLNAGLGGIYYYWSWPEQLTSLAHDRQYWRLITPALMHYDLMHLVVNLYLLANFSLNWLSKYGVLKWSLFTIVVALVSNSAQAWFTNPDFGGLSGVVFGFAGFLIAVSWRQNTGRSVTAESNTDWALQPPDTIILAGLGLILLLGFAEVIPRLSNYAHAAGLIAGLASGTSVRFWGKVRAKSGPTKNS